MGKIIKFDDYRNYAHKTEITEKQEYNPLAWLNEMSEEQYQAMIRDYAKQGIFVEL